MQSKAILLALTTASLLSGGCARESFMPAEKISGVSPQGYSAAEYDLSTKQGDFGEVRVWSAGAKEVSYQGRERTVLHIGFEVENISDAPLRMPAEGVRLDSVGLDDSVLEGIAVSRLDGPTAIAPNESARIDATFLLPEGIEPDDLDNFRLRWEIRQNGTVYAEWTPFVEQAYPYDRYAYSPVYDPYYGGAFGPPAYGMLYGYPYSYPYGYPYYW